MTLVLLDVLLLGLWSCSNWAKNWQMASFWKMAVVVPYTTIFNMLAIGSNHHPIFLNSNPHRKSDSSPFKLFGHWLDHEEYRNIIAECWSKNLYGLDDFLIVRKLKDIKLLIRVWNKEFYDNTKTNIGDCDNHLHWVHKNYFRHGRSKLLNNASKKAGEWYDIKENFWKTMSGDQATKLGDRNTKYYHRFNKCRTIKKKNWYYTRW